MYGKKIRFSRIINQETGKAVIVPIDHGTTLGPIDGIKDSKKVIANLVNGGVDAIVLHKGMLKNVSTNPLLAKTNYLMHISVSTVLNGKPENKVIVTSVEEAIKYGADGISIHVNCGGENESNMIKSLGEISESCLLWGMPLLVMIYVGNNSYDPKLVAHVARIAEELGADIVKVDYPGSIEGMRQVTESVNIPVLISGGIKKDNDFELFKVVEGALKGGAKGVSFGRNVFQQTDQTFFARLLSDFVHDRKTMDECIHLLSERSLKFN